MGQLPQKDHKGHKFFILDLFLENSRQLPSHPFIRMSRYGSDEIKLFGEKERAPWEEKMEKRDAQVEWCARALQVAAAALLGVSHVRSIPPPK